MKKFKTGLIALCASTLLFSAAPYATASEDISEKKETESRVPIYDTSKFENETKEENTETSDDERTKTLKQFMKDLKEIDKANLEFAKANAKFMVYLATDLDGDGQKDKEGYIQLYKKLGSKIYKKNQSTEEAYRNTTIDDYQKVIEDYINISSSFELKKIGEACFSMFSKKDIKTYHTEHLKAFGKALEEIFKKK